MFDLIDFNEPNIDIGLSKAPEFVNSFYYIMFCYLSGIGFLLQNEVSLLKDFWRYGRNTPNCSTHDEESLKLSYLY